MANEVLVNTLNETLGELVAARAQALHEQSACRQAVEDAKAALKRATTQEQCAIQADEQAAAKQKQLIDYVNGLVNVSQVYLEKIERLRADQFETYRLRSEASEITSQRRRALSEAETRLAVAEQTLNKLTADFKQVSTEIADLKN